MCFQAAYTAVNQNQKPYFLEQNFQAAYTAVNSKLVNKSSLFARFRSIFLDYTIVFIESYKALYLVITALDKNIGLFYTNSKTKE